MPQGEYTIVSRGTVYMKDEFLFDDPFSAEEFLEQVQTERKNLEVLRQTTS